MVADGRGVVWINLRSDRSLARAYWITSPLNRIHFKSKFILRFLSRLLAGSVGVLRKGGKMPLSLFLLQSIKTKPLIKSGFVLVETTGLEQSD